MLDIVGYNNIIISMGDNESIVPGFDQKHDESLTINLERVAGIDNGLLLKLSGYIDTYNTTLFQQRVVSGITAGFTRLIFDCTQLNYLSSTGIGSFTVFLKAVKPKNGDIVIFGLQQRLEEIFQLLGFSQFFNIVQTLSDAQRHFEQANEPEPAASVFPAIVSCPVCSRRLRAMRAGRFRCSQCKSIITIDDKAAVTSS